MTRINNGTRGSILIAALVVTLITGAVVGLFLKTITQELENAYRFRLSFQAVNLAEAGLDFALDSMRRNDWSSSAWERGAKGYYAANVPYVNYSWRGEVRRASVYIEPYASPAKAIGEGYIRLRNGMEVRRQVQIVMNNKSLFANGIVARDNVDFAGNYVYIDSYSSSRDTLNFSQKFQNRDNGSVATTSVIDSVLNLGNADVYGWIATGGGNPAIGPNGSVRGNDTPPGVRIDTRRISRDFSADLPNPVEPTMSNPATSYSSDTIGTDGMATEYLLSSVNIGGNTTVTVRGDVTLVVANDFKIAGNGRMLLAPGATLKLYVRGSADVTGNGILNGSEAAPRPPSNLMIYGTGNKAGQSIKIAGNGALFGVVYAPNYAFEGKGGGNAGTIAGAIVAKSVKFTGNTNFHFDEDLRDMSDGAKQIQGWVELTQASERRNMATILTNGL